MKRLIPILSLAVLWSLSPSWAQLEAPSELGVSMGHLHLIARNVEAEKRVWIAMGGKPIRVEGEEVIKFPGMLVFVTQGSPEKSQEGSAMNHPGIRITDTDFLGRLKAAGVKVKLADPSVPDGFAYTTEDMRVELNPGDQSQTAPVITEHLHWDMPASLRPQALAWYVNIFGAKQTRGNSADLPGAGLRYGMNTGSPDAPLPTKGRTLDHIGFEVKNLEAFCKKLEASGIRFDKPYSKTRHKGFASAELTDPWGTSIELTEGLSRY